MSNKIILKKRINNFNKKISVPGDKSLSIRWVLVASLSNGTSTAQNLLMSEDVIAALKAIKTLGVKVFYNDKICKIYGVGVNGYKYKKGIIIADFQKKGRGQYGKKWLSCKGNLFMTIFFEIKKSIELKKITTLNCKIIKSTLIQYLKKVASNNST